MNLEEMRRRKKELGYTYEQIAELSGVPLGTVQKVFAGITESPRYDTLKALEQVLREREASFVWEMTTTFPLSEKKQGDFTVEDVRARGGAEVIDGVLYDSEDPPMLHRMLAVEIGWRLRQCLEEGTDRQAELLLAARVRLAPDNRTLVIPDVALVCDRSRIHRDAVCGAPELIVEIVTKETRKKDMYIKLAKYMCSGVKEYWLVDPEKKKIMVYGCEGEEYLPTIYGFTEKVPVGILEGDCRIDFAQIYENLRFLYGK